MKLHVERKNLILNQPFLIARGGGEEKEIIIARLTFHDLVGIGEASPSSRYNDGILHAKNFLESLDIVSMVKNNPLAIKDILGRVKDSSAEISLSGMAALDMCLYDISGKILNKPLYEVLGLEPELEHPIPKTIPLATYKEMLQTAEQSKDFSIHKIKFNSDLDPSIVKDVHGITHSRIWIDVNEDWDTDEAVDKMKYLSKLPFVELVEQPLIAGNFDGIEAIKRVSNIPIILDEDVVTLEDVKTVSEIADGINVKLMKTGGIFHAIELITSARQKNLKIMLGCMIESTIGITAASHIKALVDYVDLDSTTFITNDPFLGARVDDAVLRTPKGFGLGLREK